MTATNTEAWVLYPGPPDENEPALLRLEPFRVPEIADDEALVEPLFGSWEGNMTHAVLRQPVDVCRLRREERVVLGNAGVIRVLRTGSAVGNVVPGDVCLFFGTGRYDAFGYMELAHAYDAPKTIGVLARQTKIASVNLLPLPANSRFSLQQWAAFAVRYLTAWSNWRVAYGSLRLQLDEHDLPKPYVWGWGGGTTLAELDLARRHGCHTTMISGNTAHHREIGALGVDVVDRREIGDLHFDDRRYREDAAYREAYRAREHAFLSLVERRTAGQGVSIFLDYIGAPVWRATLKALGRQGVIATAGWKHGMNTPLVRAIECQKRHIHVHTHYARLSEAANAMHYAEVNGWMPEVTAVHAWDDIPTLAREHAAGRIQSYFPVFAVNPA